MLVDSPLCRPIRPVTTRPHHNSSSPQRQYFVHTFGSGITTVSLHAGATVSHLKKALALRQGGVNFGLKHGGLELEDGKPLSDYNVQDGSTLHQCVGLSGGGNVLLEQVRHLARKVSAEEEDDDDDAVAGPRIDIRTHNPHDMEAKWLEGAVADEETGVPHSIKTVVVDCGSFLFARALRHYKDWVAAVVEFIKEDAIKKLRLHKAGCVVFIVDGLRPMGKRIPVTKEDRAKLREALEFPFARISTEEAGDDDDSDAATRDALAAVDNAAVAATSVTADAADDNKKTPDQHWINNADPGHSKWFMAAQCMQVICEILRKTSNINFFTVRSLQEADTQMSAYRPNYHVSVDSDAVLYSTATDGIFFPVWTNDGRASGLCELIKWEQVLQYYRAVCNLPEIGRDLLMLLAMARCDYFSFAEHGFYGVGLATMIKAVKSLVEARGPFSIVTPEVVYLVADHALLIRDERWKVQSGQKYWTRFFDGEPSCEQQREEDLAKVVELIARAWNSMTTQRVLLPDGTLARVCNCDPTLVKPLPIFNDADPHAHVAKYFEETKHQQ